MASRATTTTQLPPAPNKDQDPYKFNLSVKQILDKWGGNAGLLDTVITFRDLQDIVAGNFEFTNIRSLSKIQYIDGGVVRTGRITSYDAGTYFDLDYDKIVMNAKITFDSTVTGVFIGRDGADYKVNIGDATEYVKWDGTNISWKGTYAELTAAGALLITSGTVGPSTGARIFLDGTNLRVSVYDGADNEKVAMGYVNGLLKNPIKGFAVASFADATIVNDSSQNWTVNALAGLLVTVVAGTGIGQAAKTIVSNTATSFTVSEAFNPALDATSQYSIAQTATWGASDYGFWAAPRDHLVIDGDVQYDSGDFIIQHNANYLIHDYNDNIIVRMGTDKGEKGLFNYLSDGTLLSKFTGSQIYMGDEGEIGNYLKYTPAGGLVIAGSLSVSALNKLPSDDTLQGYWPFNETVSASTIAFDCTVPPYNGNIYGTPAREAAISGSGLHLDGSTNYIDFGDIFNFTTEDFSVSLWVYFDALPGYASILSKRTTSVKGWDIFYQPDGVIKFGTAQSGTNQYTSSTSVTTSTWYHLVVTRTGAVAKIYLNGVDCTDISGDHINPVSAAGTSLLLGRDTASSANFLDGIVDELRLYYSVLTPSEVKALYASPAGNPGLQMFLGSLPTSYVTGWAHASNTTKIDGGDIYTGTVTSGALYTGELITVSAQIKDAIITNAKITALDIAKLTAGTITSKDIVLALTPGGGDVRIRSGKTDFGNTTAGFILGIDDSDGDKAKFEMGNATKYINMSDGVITLSDGLIITDNVANDNITRIWNYNSDSQISIGTDVDIPSILSWTDPFVATNDPAMLFNHSELFFTPITSDTIYFEFYIMRSILVVLNGVFKWTRNGATDEYYLTNEDNGPPGIPALDVGNESILEDDVGGNGSYLVHSPYSLSPGEYDWVNKNSLGFSTLYVRLSDSTNPANKPDGYISAGIHQHTVRTGHFNEYSDDGSDNGYMPFDFHWVDDTPGTFKIYYHISAAGICVVGSYPTTSCSTLNVFSVLERKK